MHQFHDEEKQHIVYFNEIWAHEWLSWPTDMDTYWLNFVQNNSTPLWMELT